MRARTGIKTHRAGPRQALHTALWSSYLCLPDVRSLPASYRPRAFRLVVPTLKECRDKVPQGLLGLALWNLLRGYESERPPGDLRELLQEVVGLDPGTKAPYPQDPMFPLHQQNVIKSAQWQLRPVGDAGAAAATLEVLVQREFAEMKEIVYPQNWRRCDLFWAGGRGKRSPGDQTTNITARLKLPGGSREREPLPVKLAVTFAVTDLDARVDFAMEENAYIRAYRGSLEVKKEEGSPGWTRIRHDKELIFKAPPFATYPAQTLAYWLQAETLFLALSSGGGRRPRGR